ncbi:MAG: hypothetical protein JRL30_19575 [Deltaproteobacteria bacterium]|nr:hypothetical protein [Deltaproteobacteria bacterium]
MDEWRTIEPGVWKPEREGDSIVGVLVNKEPKNEQSSLSARYYLENQEGTFFVWGCAVIDDRMQYAKVGQKVRITFEGKTKNKRNQDVNLYKVEVSEPQAEKSEAVSTRSAEDPIHIDEIDEDI